MEPRNAPRLNTQTKLVISGLVSILQVCLKVVLRLLPLDNKEHPRVSNNKL